MRFFLASMAMLAACGVSSAQDGVRHGDITISAARAAPSPNGVDIAAGYLTITNAGAEDRLLSASSPRAASVEVHSMQMDGPVMRMRRIEALAVPAHGAVSLSPGGDHIMFMGLTQPFAPGETIPLHLSFERAGEVDLDLPVRGQASAH